MNKQVTTANLLDEYGRALRGDWGGIDGRSEQGALSCLAHAIRAHGNGWLASESIKSLREDLDVCPAGKGHWTDHCNDQCDVTL